MHLQNKSQQSPDQDQQGKDSHTNSLISLGVQLRPQRSGLLHVARDIVGEPSVPGPIPLENRGGRAWMSLVLNRAFPDVVNDTRTGRHTRRYRWHRLGDDTHLTVNGRELTLYPLQPSIQSRRFFAHGHNPGSSKQASPLPRPRNKIRSAPLDRNEPHREEQPPESKANSPQPPP